MGRDNKIKPSSFSVIVVFVLMIIIGASLLPLLNVQLNPSRMTPQLQVRYGWYNASARIIEQEVTSVLEGLFSSVKGIRQINSRSYKGGGYINLSFKKNVNPDAVRFEVASLIRQVYHKLPDDVSFPELSMGTGGQNTSPVMTYTLNASASPYFIQKYAEAHLAPALSVLPGVSGVNVYGSTPFEWTITYDSDLIQTLDISSSQIAQSIQQHFGESYLGQGSVSSASEGVVSGVYLKNSRTDTIAWRQIPICKKGGRIFLLGDIATVRYQEQAPTSYFRINGLNTINMVIYPEEQINNIRLAKRIRQTVEKLEAYMPQGYSLMQSSDSTLYIQKELEKVFIRTVFSLAILLLFVFFTSRQGKYLLLITISILSNLIIACIFYYLLKVEIHLYTLAGITISFGIIIDNSIIMIDHIRHQGNRKAFLAILAATLTTIGSLSMVFFLPENQRINLMEFSLVIIINLAVSLGVSLFFVPALMEKTGLKKRVVSNMIARKKKIVKITRVYGRFLIFSKRYRWAYVVLFILGFGIPVHWLPARIEKESRWAEHYNKVVGTTWFTEKGRPVIEKALGGSLRLFTQHVFERSFYSEPSRTTLHVRGRMPEGCTIQQLNETIEKMENFLSRFDEIEQFQTYISSYSNSGITITFKPDYEHGTFPFFLKEEITSKARSLGGLDWEVYGVGRGFSNRLGNEYKSQLITLTGYNYDQLYKYAEMLVQSLAQNERVNGLEIKGSTDWGSASLYEYYISFRHEGFAINEVHPAYFYSFLRDKVYRSSLPSVYANNELQPVSLVSDSYSLFNEWDFSNRPVIIGQKELKLSNFGTVDKRKSGNDIFKTNQQYRLVVAYDFVGPYALAGIVQERFTNEMNQVMPLGYSAQRDRSVWRWDQRDKTQYYLIALVILIIYFVCAILLESLRQPLAIIVMIPISFIGVFLTFYMFDFNFDQGGFASFILLSGLSINAGLYIINDYNNFRKARGGIHSLRIYLKAFNQKVIPVALTIFSSVLGLIPFVWSGQKEVFWFAFAAGAMGGLIFSIIAVLIYLPVLLRWDDTKYTKHISVRRQNLTRSLNIGRFSFPKRRP